MKIINRSPSSIVTFSVRLLICSAFFMGAVPSLAASPTLPTPADDRNETIVYSTRPLESWHVTVADFESQTILNGTSTVVPRPDNPKVPNSIVSVNVSGKDASADALALHWKDAWYASLRIDGGTPLDLRPYLLQGVLAFDVNVENMAQGGLAFKINCGKNCERKIPYLVQARALAGKGWQHLVFSMRCFARESDDFSAVTQAFALDASGTGDVTVANIKFQKSGVANTACPDYKTESVTPDMLNESWSIDWWLLRHQQKLEEIRNLKAQHENSELVFIGDSITHNWEKDGIDVWNRHYRQYHALDLGFGGDRTENVLWRLQHGEVDGIAPKVAVLMFGTNNTGARQENPMTTAVGIKRNIEELQQRLPNTKILMLAIFPRDEKPDSQLRRINEDINAIISGIADNKKIFFLNINKAFLTDDGTLSRDIMPDLLHPNATGYAIWAKAMEPELRKLMQP
ncbi:GDSL-type esterase/lipase family protein [Undibacterium sp. Ji50W]|uniref:GDSL-type esterase/lipase family protein n=1 Tax=Undibacterium sp. Ji50W TaxID=3413041 RepID=UPI003BF2F455